MPNAPLEDAVDIVYDILKSRTPGAPAGAPHADLAALGVVALVKNEPGAPYANWIGTKFGSFSELSAGGPTTVTVLVEIASQECMTGNYSHLARFTERIQKCYLLLRSGSYSRPFRIGEMSCPEPQPMPGRAETSWFFKTTLSVPVTLGGGI